MSYYTRFGDLPEYVQRNILQREKEERLRRARERGIPEKYANANLASLASIREVSRKPLFNQLAEQGKSLPPNVEAEILGYLGAKPGQSANTIIKNIAAPKKKAAHNAMVLQGLLEAQEQIEAEQSKGWKEGLREQAKLKSRAKRGKNYNFRTQNKKNKNNNAKKTSKHIKTLARKSQRKPRHTTNNNNNNNQ